MAYILHIYKLINPFLLIFYVIRLKLKSNKLNRNKNINLRKIIINLKIFINIPLIKFFLIDIF